MIGKRRKKGRRRADPRRLESDRNRAIFRSGETVGTLSTAVVHVWVGYSRILPSTPASLASSFFVWRAVLASFARVSFFLLSWRPLGETTYRIFAQPIADRNTEPSFLPLSVFPEFRATSMIFVVGSNSSNLSSDEMSFARSNLLLEIRHWPERSSARTKNSVIRS